MLRLHEYGKKKNCQLPTDLLFLVVAEVVFTASLFLVALHLIECFRSNMISLLEN